MAGNEPKAVTNIEEPLWTATRLSDVLALDLRVVRQALETQPSREINGRRYWLLRDAVPAIYRRVWKLDVKIAEPDRMTPKDRLDHWRAEREKIKLEQETRSLLPAVDVERSVSEMLKVLAQALSSLPDSLERECALNAATVNALHSKIDAARETLYLAVARLQDPTENPTEEPAEEPES
jgi:hypothetical protein